MAFGPKLSSTHTHSQRSACCGPAILPNRLGQAWPTWPGRPQDAARFRGQHAHGAVHSSACHGTARGGSPAANPRQGVYHKLPQPTVHSPDTVESPSSKRGRRATEGRNSPVWSTAPELNGGEGVTFLVREVALKLKEAPGPAYAERGGVSWLGTDGAAEGRGGCGGDGLPEANTARVRMRCRGGLLL
jgi:hypothetical protein